MNAKFNRIALAISIVIGVNTTYSQIESPNILPAEGKVGIGTTNPKEKLDVHGASIFRGSTVFKDKITLSGITDLSDGIPQFLKLNPIGEVEGITLKNLIDAIYSDPIETPICGDEISNRPTWVSEEGLRNGKMYTGLPCPTLLGVNTNNPEATIHAIGTTGNPVFQGTSLFPDRLALVLGDRSVARATFSVKGSGQTHIQMIPFAEDDRALRISSPTGVDVFRVLNTGAIYGTEYFAMLQSDFPIYPDYVFAKDYDLLPLKDLEAYIVKNKHLPNIPSAKELHEQGAVDLAEMTRLQLEKIEELTLYVIELKKELDGLKKQIEE